MKLVLATSNKGKLHEIKKLCSEYEVLPYSELMEEFEIIEDGETFKENALIKARAVYAKLSDKNLIVLADDSGISVDVLGGAPGILSARYGGEGASDRDNLLKLASAVEAKGVQESKAFYTASIAIVTHNIQRSVHGWMYGKVITQPRGEGGFGYDPIFIPEGYEKSLGELDESIKKELSHRSKALKLAKKILQTL